MVDLELALELAHAEVRRARDRVRDVEDERQLAENTAATADAEAALWNKRYDHIVATTQTHAVTRHAIAESIALLTEALPDIRRRSASRAARIDDHLVRLRSLLP